MLELRATLLTFTDVMGSGAGTSQWFCVLDLLEDAKESWRKIATEFEVNGWLHVLFVNSQELSHL